MFNSYTLAMEDEAIVAAIAAAAKVQAAGHTGSGQLSWCSMMMSKNKNKREPEDTTFLGRVIIIVHGAECLHGEHSLDRVILKMF